MHILIRILCGFKENFSKTNWIVGFFLIVWGLSGISIYNSHPYEKDVMGALYDALQLFVLNGEQVATLDWNSRNWAALFFVWFAPLFPVIAVLVLLLGRVILYLFSIRLPKKDHVIILGLGSWGIHYAKALSASGITVVAIEKELSDAAINEITKSWIREESSAKKRIHLIVGDCLSEKVLKKAEFLTSNKILPLLEDDGANIDAAYIVRKRIKDELARERTKFEGFLKHIKTALSEPFGDVAPSNPVVLLPVDNIRLSTSLATYKRFADHHGETEIRFFNIMQQAAVRHFTNHPPELYADIFKHEKIHFAIYGLGDFAMNLIYVIAHLGHFRTWPMEASNDEMVSKRVRITVYDQKIEEDALEDLHALFPNLNKIIEIVYVSTALMNIDFNKIIECQDTFKTRPVTQHIFCVSNETLSVRYATKLRRAQVLHSENNVPIFIRSLNGKGLSRLIESNCGEEEWPDNIFPLVLLSETLGENDYFSDTIDKVAKAFNNFKIDDDGELKAKGKQECWESISSDFKHSSFYEAFFLSIRLRSIGYKWKKEPETVYKWVAKKEPAQTGYGYEWVKKNKLNVGVVSDENWKMPEYEREHRHLACLEHDRWKSERWLLGWISEGSRTLGDIARIHPELEAIGSNEKWWPDYDLKQAEYLPKYLEKVGCRLVKLNTIALIEPDESNLDLETNEMLLFNLLDGKARRLVKRMLENGLEEKRTYAFLPVPFEIIKSLVNIFSKDRTLVIDVECQKIFSELRKGSGVLGNVSQLAGSVGTYIEMPLAEPFGNWKEVKPNKIDLLERVWNVFPSGDDLNKLSIEWEKLQDDKKKALADMCECKIEKTEENIRELIVNWNLAREQLKWLKDASEGVDRYIAARSDEVKGSKEVTELKSKKGIKTSYLPKSGLKVGRQNDSR